ncbi:MAG: YrhB domain-containing protein [Deltaproteobacteria bacterium]
MLSLPEAREIAAAYLKGIEPELGLELVLLDESTVDEPFGWLFFYNSRSFVETGNFSDCLVGNAPLLISRADGSLHITGTAFPVEYYVANFLATGDPHRSR